jgi:hypothetical protein
VDRAALRREQLRSVLQHDGRVLEQMLQHLGGVALDLGPLAHLLLSPQLLGLLQLPEAGGGGGGGLPTRAALVAVSCVLVAAQPAPPRLADKVSELVLEPLEALAAAEYPLRGGGGGIAAAGGGGAAQRAPAGCCGLLRTTLARAYATQLAAGRWSWQQLLARLLQLHGRALQRPALEFMAACSSHQQRGFVLGALAHVLAACPGVLSGRAGAAQQQQQGQQPGSLQPAADALWLWLCGLVEGSSGARVATAQLTSALMQAPALAHLFTGCTWAQASALLQDRGGGGGGRAQLAALVLRNAQQQPALRALLKEAAAGLLAVVRSRSRELAAAQQQMQMQVLKWRLAACQVLLGVVPLVWPAGQLQQGRLAPQLLDMLDFLVDGMHGGAQLLLRLGHMQQEQQAARQQQAGVAAAPDAAADAVQLQQLQGAAASSPLACLPQLLALLLECGGAGGPPAGLVPPASACFCPAALAARCRCCCCLHCRLSLLPGSQAPACSSAGAQGSAAVALLAAKLAQLLTALPPAQLQPSPGHQAIMQLFADALFPAPAPAPQQQQPLQQLAHWFIGRHLAAGCLGAAPAASPLQQAAAVNAALFLEAALGRPHMRAPEALQLFLPPVLQQLLAALRHEQQLEPGAVAVEAVASRLLWRLLGAAGPLAPVRLGVTGDELPQGRPFSWWAARPWRRWPPRGPAGGQLCAHHAPCCLLAPHPGPGPDPDPARRCRCCRPPALQAGTRPELPARRPAGAAAGAAGGGAGAGPPRPARAGAAAPRRGLGPGCRCCRRRGGQGQGGGGAAGR